jgi:transitional endoplasmic reticulum ATPase
VDELPAEIRALQEALTYAPDNTALRLHLGRSCLRHALGRLAVEVLREGLKRTPEAVDLHLALAEAYASEEQGSECAVVLEALEKRGELPPAGLLLFARVLSQTPELVRAAHYYRRFRESGGESVAELEAELAPFLLEEAADPTLHDGRVRLPAGDFPDEVEVEAERPLVTFAEVGGMEAVKESIRMKIIHPLKNAALFQAYGKKIGGGLLLYGPPGCGKTFLARATAGEVEANFMAVGLHDVLDMWIGQSEKNLHEIFAQARRCRPAVLFFDEVDALGASRSDMRHSGSRHTINQFLAELDGVEADNDGVLILAATNAPWHLDSAFRRPGRFDQIVFVPPPDAPARAAILRLMLEGKPVDAIDFEQLADKTERFSGADLKATVERAIEGVLERSMRGGTVEPLRTKDLLKAAKSVKPSTVEWFTAAKNYALYANQAGLYDEILDYLKIRR